MFSEPSRRLQPRRPQRTINRKFQARRMSSSPLPLTCLLIEDLGSSAAGLTESATISTWLFERKALTIALIELDGDTPEIKEINSKIQLYHTTTKLLWPRDWTTLVGT